MLQTVKTHTMTNRNGRLHSYRLGLQVPNKNTQAKKVHSAVVLNISLARSAFLFVIHAKWRKQGTEQ